MNSRMQSYLFQGHARENLERAKKTLASQRSVFFKPYFSYDVHYAAIPSSYALVGRCIQQALSISLGAFFITRSIFTLTPTDQLKNLAWATWQLAYALIVNACNVLIAMLSRNAATALNGGYLYEPEAIVFSNGEEADSALNSLDVDNQFAAFVPDFNEQQEVDYELEHDNMENVFSFMV